MSTVLNTQDNILHSSMDPIRQAIDKACIISCVFLVVVLSLFVFNQVKLASVDPQSNRQINTLIQKLSKSPKDANLKLSIRNTDQKIRAEYFRRLEFANTGRYVIGFACIVAVMSAGAAIAVRRKSDVLLTDAQQKTKTDIYSTVGSLMLALLIISLLVVNAVNRPPDLSKEYSRVIALEAKKAAVVKKSTESTTAPLNDQSAVNSSPAPVESSTPASNPPTPVLPALPGAVGIIANAGDSKEKQPDTQPSTNNNGMNGMPGMPGQSSDTTPAPQPKLPDIQLTAYDATDYAPAIDDWKANWPVFRGPYGNGVIPDANYPTKWNGASGDNLVWKADIPLPGWNSPVVWGDKVFIAGADANQRELYCYNAKDGALLWTSKLESILPDTKKPQVMEDTGYAPSTCATDGQRVFSMFPNGDVFCHDYQGTLVWKKALGLPINMYGHAASLALYKNLLIVLMDQDSSADSGLSALYALQAKDGAFVWRTIRPVPNSWTSPMVLFSQAQDMLVTSANPWTITYEPLTGKEIWRAKAATGDVAPSIAYADNKIFVTNTGSYLFAINNSGKGDITSTNIAWKMYENLPDISSPVADAGFLYMATSDGIFSCIDTATGNKHYEHPFDVTINASPIIIGKRVYLLDSQGTMHIIPTATVFSEESKGIVPDKTLATPAFAHGRIYIRGSKTLFCIGTK